MTAPSASAYDGRCPEPPYHATTDNGDTLANALRRINDLETEVKSLRRELETTKEALDGAHRVVRQIRDQQSTFPALEVSSGLPTEAPELPMHPNSP